jgi:hypothetical protein
MMHFKPIRFGQQDVFLRSKEDITLKKGDANEVTAPAGSVFLLGEGYLRPFEDNEGNIPPNDIRGIDLTKKRNPEDYLANNFDVVV